jgi:hypothetical protein
MNAFPTNIPELDLTLLLHMDDASLAGVCIQNYYLNSICNNDYFWSQRLDLQGYNYFKRFKDEGLFATYRDLYITLKTNAAYMVISSFKLINIILHSNIQDAYKILMIKLLKLRQINIEELTNLIENGLVFPNGGFIELYIIFGDCHLTLGNSQLLISINSDLNYNIGNYYIIDDVYNLHL